MSEKNVVKGSEMISVLMEACQFTEATMDFNIMIDAIKQLEGKLIINKKWLKRIVKDNLLPILESELALLDDVKEPPPNPDDDMFKIIYHSEGGREEFNQPLYDMMCERWRKRNE